MWCAEGFITLRELYGLLPRDLVQERKKIASRAFVAVGKAMSEGRPNEEFPGMATFLTFRCTGLDLLEGELLDAITGETWLCAQDGRSIRIDLNSLHSPNAEQAIHVIDYLNEQIELPEALGLANDILDEDPLALMEAFHSTCHHRGAEAALDLIEERLLREYHLTLLPYLNRATGTIDLSAHRWAIQRQDLYDPQPILSALQTISAFEGWSICVKESFAKKEFVARMTEKLRRALWFKEREERLVPTPSQSGSAPNLGNLEHVMSCFDTAFPDGKGRATWGEVQRKTGYSRRQIKRAMAALGRDD